MQKLPEILARIDERLVDLKLNDSSASKRAGKPDAIRNARRAASDPNRQGITVGTLTALADALETTLSWLADGIGPKEVRPEVGPRTELSPVPLRGGARDLPVPGIALGGSEEDGDFQLNGEVQYYLDRPAGLVGRKRAFAVVIRNDSMIDSYKPGWPIFVDPDGRQPVAGVDDVLIELYPEEEGRAGPAFVKKLLARRGSEVVLWQQNPPKELRFPLDRVKQTLRVIPYPEAMGLQVN